MYSLFVFLGKVINFTKILFCRDVGCQKYFCLTFMLCYLKAQNRHVRKLKQKAEEIPSLAF